MNTNETNSNETSNNNVSEKKVEVKFTQREKDIIELRRAGHTYKEIQDALDLPSHVTVYQACSKGKLVNHVGARETKVNDKMKEEVVRLRLEEKLTYMELAVRFNVQPQRINKILREAGLTKPRA